jgi:hypothetical protein
MTAIAIIHREEIISRVAAGHFLAHIAADIGITPGGVCAQLHNQPDYIKAREMGALVRLENQYQAINEAQDQVAISRAREGFRAAAWFAEREFPERYGGKSAQVIVNVNTLALGDVGRVSDLLVLAGAPALKSIDEALVEDLVRDAGVTEE